MGLLVRLLCQEQRRGADSHAGDEVTKMAPAAKVSAAVNAEAILAVTVAAAALTREAAAVNAEATVAAATVAAAAAAVAAAAAAAEAAAAAVVAEMMAAGTAGEAYELSGMIKYLTQVEKSSSYF